MNEFVYICVIITVLLCSFLPFSIMVTPAFVHLHLHSAYSIHDSIIDILPLIRALSDQAMPAVALTDLCNLFAGIKFYQAARAAGIKPILGAEVWIDDQEEKHAVFPRQKKQRPRLVLLCQNYLGYQNLSQLISRAYLEGQEQGVPCIKSAWLEEKNEGLIVLSGAHLGDIGCAILSDQTERAHLLAKKWRTLLPGRFYIELQRIGDSVQAQYEHAALEIASQYRLPVVATNAVCFLDKADFKAHNARVCIQSGCVLGDAKGQSKHYTPKQYLRSAEEMAALFADIPQALENSVEIAKRCNLDIPLGSTSLPHFPTPSGTDTQHFLRQESQKGLAQRLGNGVDMPLYQERLEGELTTIEAMGFAGYFLIVSDFIRWAKTQGIPVGPGRGSGAGSLVAYALAITDLDPIQHGLLFERFLNAERVSMPDFDIDFCVEGRDRVIDYVSQKYGKTHVAQIITYGKMAARAVIRDVGRVLSCPYGFVDKLAKLVPFELGVTLARALKTEPLLKMRYEQEEEVKLLIDLAMKLEGLPRNVGTHAGGVVIAPRPLIHFTPLYCEAGAEDCVTQLDKNDLESIGLIKFDFLGLRTLTIIDWALKSIHSAQRRHNKPLLNLSDISLKDKATFDLLKSYQTTGLFQLESRGIQDLIRRMQPNCFEDIVALLALYRPGPLQSGMVDDFVNRKHKRAKITYLHPLLESILQTTYGVILYQEQVMQIAQVMGGYTLGGADILRRAMGKKKPEEMARQRTLFVQGALKNDIPERTANAIFDLMEMFAGYGFNKSHSAAYALITYQTAWLKAHYPTEFMTALLSSDMDNTDKTVRYLEDAKKMGLQVLPPTINGSGYRFSVVDTGRILYGLGAIKGVGMAVAEHIQAAYERAGAYKHLFDFCKRVDKSCLNRRTLEALIRAGATDSWKVPRAVLMASVSLALKFADQQARVKQAGQTELFQAATRAVSEDKKTYVSCKAWSLEQKLVGEKSVLGWYLSGHPITTYRDELKHFATAIATLQQMPAPAANHRYAKEKKRDLQTITLAGYINSIRYLNTKSGKRAALLSLDDHTGYMDVMVFSEVLQKNRDRLRMDTLLIVAGHLQFDSYTEQNRVVAQACYDLDTMRGQHLKYLRLTLEKQGLTKHIAARLHTILKDFTGGSCPVIITYLHADSVAHMQLGADFKVHPKTALLEKLKEIGHLDMGYTPYEIPKG